LSIEDEERFGRPTQVAIPENVLPFIPWFWTIEEYLPNGGTGGLQHNKLGKESHKCVELRGKYVE
jgi:hypothetical protein